MGGLTFEPAHFSFKFQDPPQPSLKGWEIVSSLSPFIHHPSSLQYIQHLFFYLLQFVFHLYHDILHFCLVAF